MLESIKKCSMCELCKYQAPLVDDSKRCQVFWVGLSAKKATYESEKPLSPTTNSGKMICNIEERCAGVLTYKTNLVKCVPLDEQEKLRYPNKKEIDICFPNLKEEINELKPRIVFLLGDKVTKAVTKHFKMTFEPWDGFDYKYTMNDGIFFIPIHHPSYVHIYQRKKMDDYIRNVENLILKLL